MKPLSLVIISLTAIIWNCSLTVLGKPTGNQDPEVEILKQRLVRFPDDALDATPLVNNRTDKQHEAEHILQEIAKINEAFGYVKKTKNAAHSAPSVLDSAEYFYPQPAYHPINLYQQTSQPTGIDGETLLVPSIRAISYEGINGEQIEREQIEPAELLSVEKKQKSSSQQDTEMVNRNHTKSHKLPEIEKAIKKVARKPNGSQNKIIPQKIDKTSLITKITAAGATTTTPATTVLSATTPTILTTTPSTTKRSTKQPAVNQKSSQKPNHFESSLRSTEITELIGNNDQQKVEEKIKYEQPPQDSDIGTQRYSQFYPVQLPLNPFLLHSQGAFQSLPAYDHEESPELMTHFAIPVRLYKLNKEEYMSKHAVNDYPFKGYKIVGDIKDFYGQNHERKTNTKAKNKNKSKSKSTQKYQLFLLPRDMALRAAIANSKEVISESAGKQNIPEKSTEAASSSREEKFAGPRPFKIQASANTMTNNNNGITNATTNLQIVRKRIIPKPFWLGGGDKESGIDTSSGALQQQRPGGPLAASLTSIRITPPPNSAQNSMYGGGLGQGGNNQPTNNNNNNNNNNFMNNFYKNNTNAIKMAFQNIFKLPFRQTPAPPPTPVAVETPVMMQSVPLLQQQLNSIYSGASMLPQPLYVPTNQQGDDDYKWEDEDVSNSAVEEEDTTEPQEEKHVFFQGQLHKNQMQLQKEAIKHGGIIIQRLKVRKGGIAIAGPGGVATAGSGGTAIVGPGGYALTHPRSLTIAGPGAKVIAIPAEVDLQDALGRTNLSIRSFPREGKIVATGPTIYYDLGTGDGVVEA